MTENILHIWSDGACSGNPGPGGYAAAVVHENIIEYASGYSEYTTNNRMELAGFVEAVMMAINGFKLGYRHIVIHTDSKYIENAINCGWLVKWAKNGFTKIKNPEIWENIYYLIGPYKDIKVEWCKGHSGLLGNEMVDKLAVEAMTSKRTSKGIIEI